MKKKQIFPKLGKICFFYLTDPQSHNQIHQFKDHSHRPQLKKQRVHPSASLKEIQSDPAWQRIQKPYSLMVKTIQYQMRCKSDSKITHQFHRYHGYRRT